MNIQEKITAELTASMKARNEIKTGVLRQLKTAISVFTSSKDNKKNTVEDSDIYIILRKQIKEREDASKLYLEAGRNDLFDKEQQEIPFLKEFLPDEMSEEEIDDLITKAILGSGATSKKEMGKAIKLAQTLANGRVENKIISSKVSAILK